MSDIFQVFTRHFDEQTKKNYVWITIITIEKNEVSSTVPRFVEKYPKKCLKIGQSDFFIKYKNKQKTISIEKSYIDIIEVIKNMLRREKLKKLENE
jgi:hypothetical protein